VLHHQLVRLLRKLLRVLQRDAAASTPLGKQHVGRLDQLAHGDCQEAVVRLTIWGARRPHDAEGQKWESPSVLTPRHSGLPGCFWYNVSVGTIPQHKTCQRGKTRALVKSFSTQCQCSTLCGGRGSPSWKGRGPSAVNSTPPGAVPKYPDPGQQGNDLSRSQGDWIRSGAGLFPSGFPSPPTTCLNFSLWKDLSVWRIWGGYFGHLRSGLGGVY